MYIGTNEQKREEKATVELINYNRASLILRQPYV